MDLTKDVLAKDLHKAIEHTVCIKNLEFIYQWSMDEGDYTKARMAVEDIAKSLKELEQLNSKKKEYDKFIRLIGLLKEAGLKEEHLQRWSK